MIFLTQMALPIASRDFAHERIEVLCFIDIYGHITKEIVILFILIKKADFYRVQFTGRSLYRPLVAKPPEASRGNLNFKKGKVNGTDYFCRGDFSMEGCVTHPKIVINLS